MGYEIAVTAALAIYLYGVSVRDIRQRQIYNVTPFIVIMSAPLITSIPLTERLLGLAALFVPLFVASIRTDGFGMGDVKLCAAFGFLLGAVLSYIALVLALLCAAVFGKITNNKSLPLAPFLCGANMAAIILEVIIQC